MANIRAVVNISASGTVGGSNLSGTNTGDQDLSNLAITGSDVNFLNITVGSERDGSGNINAYGGITSSGIYISGSTIFGDTDTDTHTFTGHITASGDISASGIFTGEGLVISDDASITDTLTVGTINASGNISASQVFDGTYYQWEVSVLADTDDDTNWQGPPTTGLIGATNWSKDFGTVYNGVADIVQTRTNINTGWRIPHGANYSASIKSIDVYVGGATNATIDATDHLSASLWYSTAADVDERLNQTGTTGITQRHGGTAITTQVGQTLVKFNNYLISQSINVDLAPGAILWPRVKMADESSQNLLWNIYYIIHYCKKPL